MLQEDACCQGPDGGVGLLSRNVTGPSGPGDSTPRRRVSLPTGGAASSTNNSQEDADNARGYENGGRGILSKATRRRHAGTSPRVVKGHRLERRLRPEPTVAATTAATREATP